MVTKEFLFTNGDQVVEKISGFKGVITGTAYYLTGCNQYCVTAKGKNDRTEPQNLWFDEGRLELKKKKKVKEKEVEADDNGCDVPPPMGKRG